MQSRFRYVPGINISFIKVVFALIFVIAQVRQGEAQVTVTHRDSLLYDANGNLLSNKGDSLRYKTVIKNISGSPVSGAILDINNSSNLNVNGASYHTSPLALDDVYSVTGNVGVMIPAGSGVLFNDFDDNPALLSVLAEMKSTAMGGNVTIAADGSFTYLPAPGFIGTDNFTYTLEDGNELPGYPAINEGLVTLNVANLLWFIDNSSMAVTSDGRLTSPFKSLADFNASAGPQTNALIFIKHTGSNYTGGIVMKDGQIVWGSGRTGGANLADVLPFMLAAHSLMLPAINGSSPVITNAGGDGVTLAMNNALRGLNVGNCSDFAMDNGGANSVGNLNVLEVSITNTTGGGFDAGNGSGAGMNAVFGSITSTGGVNGINLTNCAGTFTGGTGAITNPTGSGVLISGGSVVFSYAGVVTDNTGFVIDIDNHDSGNVTFSGNVTSTATGLRVQNCNGGIIAFTGGSKSLTTTTNTAVLLSNNAGATINFTNGGLALSTTSGTGFSATGGATISVTGAANTISTTGGTALNCNNITIGAPNLNFQSVSSVGGTATGIILDNTGSSGGLVVDGDGINTTGGGNSSGGTISGKSGADGSTTTGCGIYLNSTQNVILRRMTINGVNQNFALRGNNVTNFTIQYCTIGGVNGTSDALDEGSMRFSELTGNMTVLACSVSGGYEDNIRVVNTAGTLTASVTSTVIGLANTQSALELNDGLYFETITGAAVINATVSGSTFRSAAGDLFQWNQNGTAACTLTFQNNTLTNHHGAIATGGGGVSLFGSGTANLSLTVSGNTFRDAVGGAVLIVKPTGPAMLSGSFSNNVIGVAGTANSGSREGSGLKIQSAGQGTVAMTVSNNQIYQYNNNGIEILTGGGAMAFGGNMNVTITGNTIANPGNFSGTLGIAKNGIHLNAGTVPGDTYQVCLDVGGAGALANAIVGSGAPNDGGAGGEDFRFRQRQSTTVRLPGYGGAITDAAAIIAYVQGRNTGSPTGSISFNAPPGGGFIGGAACQ